MILTQARGFTTDMFRCVWCDCGVYVCCTLWPLGSVAYLWKWNGDSICTVAVKTINTQYDSANASNLVTIMKKNKTWNTSDGEGKTDTQSTTNTQAQDKTPLLMCMQTVMTISCQWILKERASTHINLSKGRKTSW